MPGDVMPLAQGTRIADRYVIHSVLGEGGMGTVYLATDAKLNHKKRVLKVPVDRYSEKVLVHEAEVLAQLNHSMLPELIDVIQPESGYLTMVVMDYIDGETLEQWFLNRKSNVEAMRVMQWAIQLCDCFEYLHEYFSEPIIYRDLKPSNVMIQNNGTIRLIDFGISRYQKEDQYKDTLPFATIGFASPEQLAGQPSDVRSDLYSLGSFMYYLLSEGMHYSNTQEKISRWRADLPRSLSDFIHTLLEVSPQRRYQTASETKQVLSEIRDQKPTAHASKQSNIQTRLILVGGVSVGSGATMAALALSYELQRHKMKHVLAEYPENKPSMRSLLHNEKMEHGLHSNGVCYDFIAPHDNYHTQESREMDEDEIQQWLSLYTDPLCIVDVSNRWESAGIQFLASRAAEIWLVADPYPPGFNSLAALKHMELAIRWREMGRAVYFLANRYQKSAHLQDWLNAFPWKPNVKIPNWKPEELYRFYAEGCLKAFPNSQNQGSSLGWSGWIKKLEKRLVFP